MPESSAQIEKENNPTREPREILRDRDATLNEKIGALAKTQWTRLDKMDALAANFEKVDKKLEKTLSLVKSVQETVEESTKIRSDGLHMLREECMSAILGKKMYSMLKQVSEQSWAIFDQNETLKRQHEAYGNMEMLAKFEQLSQVVTAQNETLTRQQEANGNGNMLAKLEQFRKISLHQTETI